LRDHVPPFFGCGTAFRSVLVQQFPACDFRPENTLVLISHFANSLRTMLS
jgi:hypothetical protein